MPRLRTRTLLTLLPPLLVIGGFAWYWEVTAADRKVDALLAEVRQEEPTGVERWLIKLRLREDRRTGRNLRAVADDLAMLGPAAVGKLIRALGDRGLYVSGAARMALCDMGEQSEGKP